MRSKLSTVTGATLHNMYQAGSIVTHEVLSCTVSGISFPHFAGLQRSQLIECWLVPRQFIAHLQG